MNEEILKTIQKFDKDINLRRIDLTEIHLFLTKYGWKSKDGNTFWSPPEEEYDGFGGLKYYTTLGSIRLVIDNPKKYVKELIKPKKEYNLFPGLRNVINFMMRKK